ncbi:cytochrome P450 [Streptomyces sp. NBC_01754]|uniref:cytochrome P450 family protein n=1 Tax=Streptomyces sp. NBC_01754 TaxID=2975930 RepID=UPI002DD8B197|nr:cytochrome P450 [Streptomyces sp. NBC_01754]WSC94140.1 cytochrome P450 [Streptomyces sp. NBC_01754]
MTATTAEPTGAAEQERIVLDRFVTDLDGESARLYAAGPLAEVELPGGVPVYAITHYAEAKAALTDSRLVKDIDVWGAWQRGEIPRDWPLIGLVNPGRTMLTADGAEHRRLRGLVAQALTARRVERLRTGIEARTKVLLDRLAVRPAGETVDLKAEFAYPLPMNVISELMGVDSADLPRMKTLFDKFFSNQTPPAEVPQTMAAIHTLFSRILDEKKRSPADDLTGALLTASENGDHLTDDEILNTLKLIIAAGHETTISLIVNAVVALETHPEQRRAVLAGEVGWDSVIEETLRWSAPTSHILIRFATEDIEVGDRVLPKGEGTMISFAALSRDEKQWGPTATDFDVTRSPNRHISFGHGPHVCPGAALSRLEAAVALPALYERFPDLALAVAPSELRNKPIVTQNDLYELPVTLG